MQLQSLKRTDMLKIMFKDNGKEKVDLFFFLNPNFKSAEHMSWYRVLSLLNLLLGDVVQQGLRS